MSRQEHNAIPSHDELLLALVEGELDAGREAAVLASLDAATLHRVRSMRRQCALLRSAVDAAPPAALLDRVGSALERQAIMTPGDRTFPIRDHRREHHAPAFNRWRSRGAMAAGLALLTGGALYLSLWSTRPASTGVIALSKSEPFESVPMPDARREAVAPAAVLAANPPISSDAATPDALHQDASPEAGAAVASADDPQEEFLPFDWADWNEIPYASSPATRQTASATVRTASHGSPPASSFDPHFIPLGVFSELPASIDLEEAAVLAAQGRLVIRVRADRPAIAAVRLLGQADNRANKGRLWRLMPCPPSDYSEATEAALSPARSADGTGLTVPYRAALRPAVEATLTIELDPSASTIAVVQAELENISEGAVILDELNNPVFMPPPCDDDGIRGWTSSPSSVAHSVVVPVIVEAGE